MRAPCLLAGSLPGRSAPSGIPGRSAKDHHTFGCVALLALLLALPTPPVCTAAEPEAVIRFEPAALEVGQGLTGALAVRVEGVQELYGYDIRLAFDPAVVQVADADETMAGVQVRPEELLATDVVARNAADNTAGQVWVALSQANPSPEVSGSGTAFTVTFIGGAREAQSTLTVAYARLATRDGREIPVRCEAGEIRVVAAAVAPATPTASGPPSRPALELTASAPAPTSTAAPASTAVEPTPTHTAEPTPPATAPTGAVGTLAAALVGGLLVLGADAWWRRRRS